MRILMVEDHEKFAQSVIAEFLHEHEVTVVGGVDVAKQRLKDGNFDIVLVDYDLPDGKGDEVVRWMRVHDLAMPVVATSSHEYGNNQLRAAGADVICSKMKFRQLPELLRDLGQTSG